jgi:hypothetical protein
LDVLFAFGGLVLAGLLVVAGLVLTSNADFAKTYVRDQLSRQDIRFKAEADLTEEERASACLVENAGQRLLTGKQAECYANEFIGLHLKAIPNADGKSYAALGDLQTELRAQIATAQASGDPLLPALQKRLADVSSARETVFKGETLRGLLLTSYGFSVLGVKGGEVATICYGVALLLALLSLAGVVHAFRTPPTRAFAPPAPERERDLVGV